MYAISVLILLFNGFACTHGWGILNYKAWCAWNAKKHILAWWLSILLVIGRLWVRTLASVWTSFFSCFIIFAKLGKT